MTIQQTIQQKLPQLPPELQQDLLDFMEYLLSKAKLPHHYCEWSYACYRH